MAFGVSAHSNGYLLLIPGIVYYKIDIAVLVADKGFTRIAFKTDWLEPPQRCIVDRLYK